MALCSRLSFINVKEILTSLEFLLEMLKIIC
jgi:hypothetical protein